MNYDIHQGDLLAWAAEYTGPKFHALLCDPPYHLTEITKRFGKADAAPAQFGTDGAFARASKGFMGKQWDGGDIAFRPETWAALSEHLHPGAYGMAFASTRGYHRMACAIEDAGLIIGTMLGWSFGCLSEDTEILTGNGWEPYHKAIAGTSVLCYNTASGSLEWHAVQELYVYAYDDTAYHIYSDNTDQIVSRNHRCLVKRGGSYVFRFAETLQRQEIVPILDAMPDMRGAVQCGECDRIQPQALLQPDLFKRSHSPRASWQNGESFRSQGRNGRMPPVRQGSMEASGMASQKQANLLFALMSGKARNRAAAQTTCGEWQGQKATGQRVVGRAQSGMEGGRNLFQDTRQLYGRQIRALSCGVPGNGAQGWLCDGASLIRCASDRAPAAALRGGTSYRSQPSKQRAEQSATVRQQPRSQALRTSWGARPDLATVTPIHYHGKVWCVRVPTGAFVARRNGQVFITGNSGFPKATRVDTQIDRMAGVDRAVVGSRKHAPKFDAKRHGYREKDNGFNSRERESFDVTAPATDLAAAWEGHRYGGQAIKPAFEPIVVFQRPYQGRPVESITRTGAGALNVDGGRIAGSEVGAMREYNPRNDRENWRITGGSNGSGATDPAGRWPANLLLSHNPDCNGVCTPGCAVAALGAQSGELTSGAATKEYERDGRDQWGMSSGQPHEGSTGTAARFFFNADYMFDRIDNPVRYVAKASTAEREAGLDDWAPTTVDDGRAKSIDNPYQRGETERRNIHPTVKPIDLCRYLATLLLPPDIYAPRRLLIPFSGSGSEMIGAGLAGWDECQGIELEADHVAIARARLAWWIDVFEGKE